MRVLAATLAILITTACLRGSKGSSGTTEDTVGRTEREVLAIASTQLRHHGFAVTLAGDNVVVTQPRLIPAHLQDSVSATKGKMWLLHVTADRASFAGGTRVRVVGYIVPAHGGQARAVPVTASNPKLYREVVAATGWIVDEARRKKPKS